MSLPAVRPASAHAASLFMGLVLVTASGGGTLYHQDFKDANQATGLPSGWSLGPPANTQFFSAAVDSGSFGRETPSALVDLPLRTLDYWLGSPRIMLPRMDQDYTLEFALRVDQPDSPFRTDIVYMDLGGNWHHGETLLSLVGEMMDSLRVFRISFNPEIGPEAGRCWVTFGLSYAKVLRAGRFWLDDFELREGRETGILEFYLTPQSIAAGEDVGLHISSHQEQVTVHVWREEDVPVLVSGPIQVAGSIDRQVPEEVWRVGCGWPVSARIHTDTDWASGVYTVKIDDGEKLAWDTFVVGGTGEDGNVLVILPTHTDQAYNGWGGGSFYSQPQRPEISFERPSDHGYLGVYQVPIHLIRWLHREGIPYGVADDTDLHDSPELLFSYPGAILLWHSEYWTGEMRRNMELYIDSGGSLLCFSGNTCWWQTRLVDANDPLEPGPCRRLICYKYAAEADPYQDIDPGRVTTHWDESPVNDPPNRFLGLSWRTGGMVNWSTSSSCPCEYDWLEGHGGYTTFRTDHWIYEGTGLVEGDTFGQEYAIVGYEVDSTPVEWIDGRPEALPDGGTPPGFVILGHAPSWNAYSEDGEGAGMMGILDRGSSFVFNGGTTGWCWGLAADPAVQRVTANLIEHLSVKAPEYPKGVKCQAYPNPAGRNVILRILGHPLPPQLDFFAVDGRWLKSVPVRPSASSAGFAMWDFRDNSSRSLPAGIYYAGGGSDRAIAITHVK